MAATGTNLVTLPKEVTEAILANVQKNSAVQRLAKFEQLTAGGIVIPQVGRGRAGWVGEAGKKPVSNSAITEIEMMAKKLARITYLTEELADDAPSVERKIVEEATISIGESLDATVLGEISAPQGFSSLAGTTRTVEVSDYPSWNAAVSSVNGRRTSGLLVTLGFLDAVRGIVDAFGHPLFQVVGDDNSGTINGKRYEVTTGTDDAVAYAGPWAERAMYGTIPGSVRVKKSDEASFTDGSDRVDLFDHDLIAYRLEGRFGFKVFDVNEFTKITIATPGS